MHVHSLDISKVLATVAFTFVSAVLVFRVDTANAAYTDVEAKVDKIYTGGVVHIIDVDSTLVITPPFVCANWQSARSGVHRAYISPITDDVAKAQLAEALTALTTGKKISYSATSCYGTSGYPKIDYLYIVP